MAFWNRKESRSSSGLTVPADWLTDAWAGAPASAGTRVSVESALGLAPVWSAVSLISEQVGQLPLKVYKALDDGEKEEARAHRSWRMLHDRPNSTVPAGRFWATITAHLLLYGNAFIEKTTDETGIVDELWILPPSEVTVKWWPGLRQKTFLHRPARQPVVTGRPGGPADTGERELDDTEVLHIFNNSIDGIVGLSVIDYQRQSLGTAIARDEFEGEFYANGAVLSGLIEMDDTIKSQEALTRFKDSFRALFTGRGRRHGFPVLEGGAKFRQVGSPLRDLEFVSSQQMTRGDVAIIFKLPPNYLAASSGDSLTYATLEANQTQFALNAIAPITKTISDALSQDPSLMPQTIHTAEFVLEGMLRPDAKTRVEVYQALVAMKAMLPSEVRKKENLPPLTDAQKRELEPPPAPAPAPPVDVPSPPANGNGLPTLSALPTSPRRRAM
jgi:HK97 family phage portal protein